MPIPISEYSEVGKVRLRVLAKRVLPDGSILFSVEGYQHNCPKFTLLLPSNTNLKHLERYEVDRKFRADRGDYEVTYGERDSADIHISEENLLEAVSMLTEKVLKLEKALGSG
jgi:hypothetical protein